MAVAGYQFWVVSFYGFQCFSTYKEKVKIFPPNK